MSAKSRERREKWAKVQEAREVEGLMDRWRFADEICFYADDTKLVSILHQCPIIVADEIQEYIDNLPDNATPIEQPIIMPPYQQFFVEMIVNYADTGRIALGYLCEMWDTDSNFAKFLPDPSCIGYMTVSRFFSYKGRCDECSRFALLPINQLGEIANYHGTIATLPRDPNLKPNQSDSDFASDLGALLYTLTFINCKNVELAEVEPAEEDAKTHQRQANIALVKYKRLTIKSGRKHTDGRESQQAFDVMPLHLRRGNFAHYTDEAPLFGKYTGTFWRPATVVGSEKNGIVVKDYKVKPNE